MRVSADPTPCLLSNFRRIVAEDSALSPRVFKKHDAAAIFGREDDPFASRPLVIAAFPFGIQYLPVIHSNHIVGRRATDKDSIDIVAERGSAFLITQKSRPPSTHLVSFASSFRTIAEPVPIYQISISRSIRDKARNSWRYRSVKNRRNF